jgi:hypothetical protein
MSDTDSMVKEFDSPTTTALAEMILLRADLQITQATMTLLIEKYSGDYAEGTDNYIIASSLYRDAIVRFMSCFEKGRFNLERDLIYPTNAAGPHAFFDYLKDIRDSSAAHRFGANRQCIVGPAVHPDQALAIAHLVGTIGPPNKKGLSDIRELMRPALNFALAEEKRLTELLFAEASKLSLDQIKHLPVAHIIEVDASRTRETRKEIKQGANAGRFTVGVERGNQKSK